MPINIMSLFITIPIVILTLTFVLFIRQASRPEEAGPDALRSWQRSRTVGYWASTVSLAIVYIIVGTPKISGLSNVLHRFEEWGYSEEFMLFIGASEFIAGIFLLIPRTSFFAATYLGIIMSGAVYTHLAFDTAYWALLPAFCLSFLVYIGYEDIQRGHVFAAKDTSPAAA